MGANAFSEFVARQQPVPEEAQIDWAAERDQFLSNLDLLFRQVDGFLEEYTADGSVTRRFTQVSLTEEDIGTYSAPRMEIRIGRQAVSLQPIGTLLIGSKGRVDAVGTAGRAQILLVNAHVKRAADLINVTVSVTGGRFPSPPPPGPPPPIEEPISWTWKIVTRNPSLRGGFGFVELDKESFFSLLMEVANG
jgi:hypothetical protein